MFEILPFLSATYIAVQLCLGCWFINFKDLGLLLNFFYCVNVYILFTNYQFLKDVRKSVHSAQSSAVGFQPLPSALSRIPLGIQKDPETVAFSQLSLPNRN